MKNIDLTNWKRKEHFDFFSKMASPIFGLVTEVNCDECYKNSEENGKSFFANYLHKSDRKSTRLNSSHLNLSRMPSSA